MQPTITDSDALAALRSFLLYCFPDSEVIATQDNEVPQPKGSFIAMTKIMRSRLATNGWVFNPDDDDPNIGAIAPTELTIQVDFYGKGAGDRAQTFATLFFDTCAYDVFPDGVKPLYCSDPVQIPLISGEKKYVERWKSDAKIQINPTVYTPMDYIRDITLVSQHLDTIKE